MKQKTNTTPNRARRLITAGIIMLLATPIIQPLYIAIAQSGCPLVDGHRECGFDPGLQIAVFANALPWVWLTASAILIIAGIVNNRSSK